MKQRGPLSERIALLNERRAPLNMRKKIDVKHETRAYICPLDKEICQVRKDGELVCQVFPQFAKEVMDVKSFANCWR
jgi:hypothetical protein